MKSIIIFLCLTILIHSKEPATACNYLKSATLDGRTYSECKELIEDNEDSQCCVAVLAMFGQNQYFCETFDKNATEEDISKKMETDYINYYHTNNPGTYVRARANCKSDVEPYPFNKCTAEQTQVNNELKSCSNFERNSDSNYCCLFSASVVDGSSSQQVNFCEELSKSQAIKYTETEVDIESNSGMNDVKFMMNCTPSVPENEDEELFSYKIDFNFLIFTYLLILIF